MAVGERAAQQDEHGARRAHQGDGNAEAEAVARQAEHEPGQGQQAELVAQHGTRPPPSSQRKLVLRSKSVSVALGILGFPYLKIAW
jgi:hypothetical protein